MTEATPPASAVELPGPSTYLKMVLPALAVGIGSGLSLIGVSALAKLIDGWVWDDLSSVLGADRNTWWWILVVLTATGLAIGLVVKYAPGHAGPDPATSGLVSKPLPFIALPGLALALVLMLAGGVSLGPENPIIAVNASLAALIGMRYLPKSPPPLWIGFAVAGTLGAMFGTPVAAALMLTEAQPGNPAIPIWDRLFGPLVAAGAGSATMLLLSDLDMKLDVPDYSGFDFGDLGIAIVIALVTCACGVAAAYALTPLHTMFHRIKDPVLMLTAGGFVLGVLGAIGGQETLFKGLDEMKSISAHISDYSDGQLLFFAVVKFAALLVAAAASFRGGRIFPSVFIGVVIGWSISGFFDFVPPAIGISAAALGITLAVTRNGWLSLFLAVTLVPDPELLPLLVLASLPAWLLVAGKPELTVHAPVETTAGADGERP